MTGTKKALRISAWLGLALLLAVIPPAEAQTPAAQPAAPGSPAHFLGTVESVTPSTITLTTDAGAEVNVLIQTPVTMVRTAPGHKDLQGATTITLREIQPGDRMLVRGKLADDGKSIVAQSGIVMKHEDIAQRQQQEQEAWRRGINGVVKTVDPAAGVVTIATGSMNAKMVSVHIAKNTIIRRYSPDSVKFDDAKVSSLADIHPGDQLRARGDRSADGNDFNAQEIVSGAFRNVAGTVLSTDAANNTVTVTDLLTKQPLTVKIGSDSQLRKLSPMIAQGIAMRLKGGAAGTPGAPGGACARPRLCGASIGKRPGRAALWRRSRSAGWPRRRIPLRWSA